MARKTYNTVKKATRIALDYLKHQFDNGKLSNSDYASAVTEILKQSIQSDSDTALKKEELELRKLQAEVDIKLAKAKIQLELIRIQAERVNLKATEQKVYMGWEELKLKAKELEQQSKVQAKEIEIKQKHTAQEIENLKQQAIDTTYSMAVKRSQVVVNGAKVSSTGSFAGMDWNLGDVGDPNGTMGAEMAVQLRNADLIKQKVMTELSMTSNTGGYDGSTFTTVSGSNYTGLNGIKYGLYRAQKNSFKQDAYIRILGNMLDARAAYWNALEGVTGVNMSDLGLGDSAVNNMINQAVLAANE